MEWKKLGEVAEIGTGKSNRKDEVEDGIYPFYVRSKNILKSNKYIYDEEAIIIPGEGGIGEIFHYVNGKYDLHQRAYRINLTDKNIDTKYLYYYFINNFKEYIEEKSFVGTVSSIRLPMLKEFEIPLTPLQKQQQIADLLDRYTNYKDNLISNLKKELELRKKQYEYYRDKMFEFDDVEYVKLDDVLISLKTGLNPRKFFRLNTEDATNYYITIKEMINGKIVVTDKTDKINDEALILCNNRSNLEKEDLLFSGTGTVGVMVVIEEEIKNWNIKEGIFVLKPKKDILNTKYLKYLLETSEMKKEYLSRATRGTMTSISMKELKELEVPLPDLQTQQQIATTLSAYEEAYNELVASISLEISMREKEYCYYRDLLFNNLNK